MTVLRSVSYAIICGLCSVVFTVSNSSERYAQYMRNTRFDNKMCPEWDILTTANVQDVFGCLINCTGQRCGTLFYHPKSGTCTGCVTMYTNASASSLPVNQGTLGYVFHFDCPDGDGKYKSACYRWQGRSNWHSANENCTSLGTGNLAVPNSLDEQIFMLSWAQTKGEFGLTYLGITDIEVEGTWLTVQGYALEYSNWTVNQPNNAGDGQHCGALAFSGGWHDTDCDLERYSVCEIEMLTTL